MSPVHAGFEGEHSPIGRVHYSKLSQVESYLPSPLYLPSRPVPYQQTTPPPETPGLSTAASSPPSHFPSSSPFSERRRNSPDFSWDYSANQDLDDAPPLTATASEFSEMDDSLDSISEGNYPSPDGRSQLSLASTRYREGHDVLIAAEALILFSHRPLEKIAGPSTVKLPTKSILTSPRLGDHAIPSVIENATPHDGTILDCTEESSSMMMLTEKHFTYDSESEQSVQARPRTPESFKPHFKRILSNISTGSLLTPPSPSHRPRKKSRPESEHPEPLVASSSEPFDQFQITSEPEERSLDPFICNESQISVGLPPEASSTTFGKESPISPSDTSASQSQTPHSPVIDQAELQGHIISILALSRSSSMTISAIVKQLLSNQPGLSGLKSRPEWIKAVNQVLDEPSNGRSVFSRVERVGKDAASRRLENQYYYNPENDPDRGRAEILREMVPKKRGVTKQHRQYYFEPVGKHSAKWDPEDK